MRRDDAVLAQGEPVIPPQSHAACMVCGGQGALGLQFHACADGVLAFCQAQAHWQGYAGVLHGGMISTLLDAAMTHCLFRLGVEAMTADLQVRFLKPVPCACELEIRAHLVSQRRQLFVLAAELRVHGEVLAHSEARFLTGKK